MRSSLRLGALALVTALSLAAPASLAGDDPWRQPATFPHDATITSLGWIDLGLSYGKFKDSPTTRKSDQVLFDFRGAYQLFPKFELGLEGGVVSRNYDREGLGDPSGLTDTSIWAKYMFVDQGTFVWSTGAIVSLPTGDEKDYLGTGSVDPGVFLSAGAKTQGNGFIQAHVGLRFNGDWDGPGPISPSTGPGPVELSGKTSVFVGFGGSLTGPSGVEAFASVLLETERYDQGDSAASLTGGARWPIASGFRLQAFASAGLSDAAPQFELGFGAVFNP